jgi:hypothetical protein
MVDLCLPAFIAYQLDYFLHHLRGSRVRELTLVHSSDTDGGLCRHSSLLEVAKVAPYGDPHVADVFILSALPSSDPPPRLLAVSNA